MRPYPYARENSEMVNEEALVQQKSSWTFDSEGLICGYKGTIVGHLYKDNVLLKVHSRHGICCLQSVLILPCTPCLTQQQGGNCNPKKEMPFPLSVTSMHAFKRRRPQSPSFLGCVIISDLLSNVLRSYVASLESHFYKKWHYREPCKWCSNG